MYNNEPYFKEFSMYNLSEQTEKTDEEDRIKPKESEETTEPFLDFGDDDLQFDEDSDFTGNLPKLEKKAPPKNGE